MTNVFPRDVSPERIEAGDTIEVEYKEVDGITSVKRGTVAYIQHHGAMRHFVTQQGASIAVYQPGSRTANHGKTFRLLARYFAQTPMFDTLTEAGRL